MYVARRHRKNTHTKNKTKNRKMRAVLFCLVVSANALPEAHLRGSSQDHLRDRDLSVPEDAKNYYANTDASSDEISATNLEEGGFLGKLLRRFGLASSEETAGGRVGGVPGPEGAIRRLYNSFVFRARASL